MKNLFHLMGIVILLTLPSCSKSSSSDESENSDANYVETYVQPPVVLPFSRDTIIDSNDVEKRKNPIGGVDLGLPSGTIWSAVNLGATKPEGYGYYFKWATVEPIAEDNTSIKSKFVFKPVHEFDYDYKNTPPTFSISGNKDYDAATFMWGENWQLPTEEDFNELRYYCKWFDTELNGIKGYKIIGESGKWIFFPKTGSYNFMTSKAHPSHITGEGYVDYLTGTIHNKPATRGALSSISRNSFRYDYENPLAFKWDNGNTVDALKRGYAIRPVSKLTLNDTGEYKPSTSDSITIDHSGELNGHKYVDLGLPSGNKWATINIGASSTKTGGSALNWGQIVSTFKNEREVKDIAEAEWGEGWLTPTKEDYEELIKECNWYEMTDAFDYEVKYYIVQGPNENAIIIPFDEQRVRSGYWTSTQNGGNLMFYFRTKIRFNYKEGNFLYTDPFDTRKLVRAIVKN